MDGRIYGVSSQSILSKHDLAHVQHRILMSMIASQQFSVHLQQPMQHLHTVAVVFVHVMQPFDTRSMVSGLVASSLTSSTFVCSTLTSTFTSSLISFYIYSS